MDELILKRAPFGPDQNQDDFDVLADGVIVGRIFFTEAAFEGRQWVCGYEATREAALAAFARSWCRQ